MHYFGRWLFQAPVQENSKHYLLTITQTKSNLQQNVRPTPILFQKHPQKSSTRAKSAAQYLTNSDSRTNPLITFPSYSRPTHSKRSTNQNPKKYLLIQTNTCRHFIIFKRFQIKKLQILNINLRNNQTTSMSVKKELQQSWKYVLKIARNKNSFEIGFLHHICNILLNEQILSSQYCQSQKPYFTSSVSSDFVNSVTDFLQQVLQKPQRKSQQLSSCQQHLCLIVLESIIFNLYARSKNMDKLRLNNSFFNNSVSMSMSQMSDQFSEHNSVVNNDGELKLALSYIQALATNSNFFKKLKVLYERPQNKQKNQHYLQNLFETMQYVLNKEKLTPAKQTFTTYRIQNFKAPVYTQPQPFSPTPQILQVINSAIFTNQLNKLTTLFSSPSEQALFSINRIYFMNRKSSQRKHFRNLKYSSTDMVYNLCRVYVESFSKKMEVLQQSRNPLFLWIKNYLKCFYLPVFRRWVGMVAEFVAKDTSNNGVVWFYKNNQQLLQKGMLMLIEQLPTELVQFLNMLYRLIDKHFNALLTPTQNYLPPSFSPESFPPASISSLIPVKRLFIYSFLNDPQLIKQHIFAPQNQAKSPVEIQKFQQTCNYMINLFFSSSVKKFATTFTQQQLSVLINLSLAIEQRLDEKLTQCDPAELYYEINDDSQTRLSNYFIQEPILNYDYEVLHKRISETDFTPKDLKQFDMKKDFVYGGSKEMLLHKDTEEDFVFNNDLSKAQNQNMRYMRKDAQIFVNQGQNNRKFPYNREHIESPSKFDDREQNNQRPHKQQNANTFNSYKINKGIQNYHSDQANNLHEEVDFLTWMTVGGNHNYKQKISAKKIKLARNLNFTDNPLTQQPQNIQYFPDKTKSFVNKKFGNTSIIENDPLNMTKRGQLKEFKTFNKDKVKEIDRLYQQYQSKNLFG